MYIKAICQKLKQISTKVLGNKSHSKILFNTGWLLIDRILRMTASLFIGVWIARYLGPDQFGKLNYAIAWVSIFANLANLGLDSIVIRELVEKPREKNSILGTTFALKLTGGIITCFLLIVSSRTITFKSPLTPVLISILSLGTIFQSLDTIELWFQSQVKSSYIVIGKITGFFLINIAKVILLLKKAPLVAFAWTGLGETVLGVIGLLFIYKISGDNIFNWKISYTRAQKLLSDSYPLIFSGLLIMIYMRVDQIMISFIRGEKELGLYSAAVRIAEIWYFIPMAIASTTLPSIVEAKQGNEKLFYTKLQKLYSTMALIGYLIAIPVSISSHWLILFLFGGNFSGAATMLSILVWAGIFVNLGIARSSFLTAMNWAHIHVFTVLIGAITNVILNLILIPKFGGVGASFATIFAYWVAAHLSCFLNKKLVRNGMMITKSLFLQGI